MTMTSIAGSQAAAPRRQFAERRPEERAGDTKPVYTRNGADAAFAHRFQNYHEDMDVPPPGLDIEIGDDEVFYPANDVREKPASDPASGPARHSVVSTLAPPARQPS